MLAVVRMELGLVQLVRQVIESAMSVTGWGGKKST